MANSLSFNDIATLANSIVSQATGRQTITPTDTASFVTVGQMGLMAGYDPLNTAISQVLSRTILNYRPYNRKFKGLEADSMRWGNMVRELDVIDTDLESDDRLALVDGESIDQMEVKKPKILQTNYYGTDTFQDHITIYKDQLDSAFNNPDEFARFVQMIMGNMSDRKEQALENLARMTMVNFIGGKIDANNGVRHLVTEYNAYTGLPLTPETVKQPEYWPDFVKWMYAEIRTAAALMTERSILYHVNVTGKEIAQHTPYANQKLYLNSCVLHKIDTQVLSAVFNDEKMKLVDHDEVNFWQTISAPTSIDVTPVYMGTDGNLVNPGARVQNANVLGVLFDELAMGYNIASSWMAPTPFNSRGGYTNYWLHSSNRWVNAFHRNAMVFLLD